MSESLDRPTPVITLSAQDESDGDVIALARAVFETQEALPTLGDLFAEVLHFVPDAAGAREHYRRQFRLCLVAWTKAVLDAGRRSAGGG